MIKEYYEIPTQCVFLDPGNMEDYLGGIVYHDEIICGCCGGIFELEETLDIIGEENFYAYNNWAPISEEIIGDANPLLSWGDE